MSLSQDKGEETDNPQIQSSVSMKKKAKEDFRTKQIQELEKLQKVLDENTLLRSKFNALQAQVAPLVDSYGPAPTQQATQFQNDRILTPEEIEALKQKLEQTLTEYRDETRVASLLNSEIEKKYNELSSLKMKFRLDQDEKLTKQNQTSEIGMTNFKAKSQRVNEVWSAERQRLNKAINFLRSIYESSSADTKEYDEQMRTNNRGIQHLSSSITIAREDIRDFTEQLMKIEPKLQEYFQLKDKHQKSEELVVKLSDEVDQLKKQVDTESLTANVRRQIDYGNRTIADLNRSIDQVINKTATTQDKIKETKNRIASLEKQLERTKNDTDDLRKVAHSLIRKKEAVKIDLDACRKEHENSGGENALIAKELNDGISLEQTTAPWGIRKQLLELKGEIQELDKIEEKQIEFESQLSNSLPKSAVVPLRKRVPMIPMKKQFP
ncbi:hypothetical protein TRFO_33440 [Tritrichomonas foetus]|uniref:Uncharacterized protein n=1 Tax=Tritrichomonas foetus TaxID=1144522 RepID=A0A1J4JLK5_9EUKA|nr:hypothetical protein TRFO_33440 [Tritrichomonas foetus]|eukprot:OHS99982.1 hypothetical protein TRFO_33440 [Tritrichomonas foetus]